MIVEYIRYRLHDGEAEAFLAAYETALEPLMRSPFALWSEVCQCVEEPECMVVRIHWTSADDHLQGFRKSAEFRDFFGHIKPYLDRIEEMRHYERRSVFAAGG